MTTLRATGTCIRGASKFLRSRMTNTSSPSADMNTSSPSADMWSGTRSDRNSFPEPKSGVGDPFGTGTRNPNQNPPCSPLDRFLAPEGGSNGSTNRSPKRSCRRFATRPREVVPLGILNGWNRPSNDWACSPLCDPEDDLASEIRPHSMTTSPDPFFYSRDSNRTHSSDAAEPSRAEINESDTSCRRV